MSTEAYVGESITLDADEVHVLDPIPLAGDVRVLKPVPVWLGNDETGTVWWGGHGAPTTTTPGVKPGDYYLDYTDGEVYRLVADYF